MTILLAYMVTPGGLTGAPRRLLNLCRALAKSGIEPVVATSSESALSLAASEHGLSSVGVDAEGVLALRHGVLLGGGPVFKLRVGWALFRHNLTFLRIIIEQKADIVWTRGSKGVAFALLAVMLSRRRMIWDVDYELPSKGFVRCLHKLGLTFSSVVIFQYSAAPDEIFGESLAGRYRHKFRVILPGIDLKELDKTAEIRQARVKKPGGPFCILQVGTVCDRKNQLFLLEALTLMKGSGSLQNVVVKVAGGFFEEDYVGRVRERIVEAGLGDVVQLMGWRNDVHELMADADLLVIPSKDEGVPNVVQEAMYIGLPVVAAESGGMPEIILHGETGWVLPLGQAACWAAQISECVRQPGELRRVGAASKVYASRYFGIDAWGAEYASVVYGVANNS